MKQRVESRQMATTSPRDRINQVMLGIYSTHIDTHAHTHTHTHTHMFLIREIKFIICEIILRYFTVSEI